MDETTNGNAVATEVAPAPTPAPSSIGDALLQALKGPATTAPTVMADPRAQAPAAPTTEPVADAATTEAAREAQPRDEKTGQFVPADTIKVGDYNIPITEVLEWQEQRAQNSIFESLAEQELRELRSRTAQPQARQPGPPAAPTPDQGPQYDPQVAALEAWRYQTWSQERQARGLESSFAQYLAETPPPLAPEERPMSRKEFLQALEERDRQQAERESKRTQAAREQHIDTMVGSCISQECDSHRIFKGLHEQEKITVGARAIGLLRADFDRRGIAPERLASLGDDQIKQLMKTYVGKVARMEEDRIRRMTGDAVNGLALNRVNMPSTARSAETPLPPQPAALRPDTVKVTDYGSISDYFQGIGQDLNKRFAELNAMRGN